VGTDGRMANSLVVSMGNGGGSGRQAATPAAHGERPAERGRRRRGDSSSRSPIFKTRARASGPAPPRPPVVQIIGDRRLVPVSCVGLPHSCHICRLQHMTRGMSGRGIWRPAEWALLRALMRPAGFAAGEVGPFDLGGLLGGVLAVRLGASQLSTVGPFVGRYAIAPDSLVISMI